MSGLRGAGAVVRALEDAGVRFAFGIPGTHNVELWDRLLESPRIRPVAVTDEQSASFMADGLWRASGNLGCVNVVPGAGLTHALSGIAEAFLDGVPMLVLGCGIRSDTGHVFQLHDVDQLAIARPVTKGVFRPVRGDQLYEAVRGACALAAAPPAGPVMVEIPANLYLLPDSESREAAVPGSRSGIHLPAPAVPDPVAASPAPDPDLVRQAAGILTSARRPLLYLGLGAAGAATDLVRLAERLEMPVFTTLSGKGVFPEAHPLAVWPGGGEAAPPFARRIAGSCDATLAIGCRFSEVGTGSYGFAPPSPVVHVDVDPGVHGRNVDVDLPIVSDAASFTAALLGVLSSGSAVRSADPELRALVRDGVQRSLEEMSTPGGSAGVSPGRILASLQERWPDASFSTDSGNGTFLAAEGLRLAEPGRFLAPTDFSCMGYSVPAAIGAALGRPDHVSVALVGDGAFLMTGLEILTAASLSLPVLFVVLRDRELAQIAQFQSVALGRRSGSRVPDYDLSAICSGVGVECIRLGSDDDIPRMIEAAGSILERPEPVVIDVEIDYSRKTWFTRGVMRTNFLRLPWPARMRFVARALGRRLSAGGRIGLF